MAKLLALMADKGIDRELPAPLANALGLGAAGQPWLGRSLSIGEVNTDLRGFAVSRGADQDIVVSLSIPGKSLSCYRAHRDGTVTTAIVADLTTLSIATRDRAEAQKSFNGEIAVWAKVAGNTTTASNN
jgi:hypothetical protein